MDKELPFYTTERMSDVYMGSEPIIGRIRPFESCMLRRAESAGDPRGLYDPIGMPLLPFAPLTGIPLDITPDWMHLAIGFASPDNENNDPWGIGTW